MKKMLLKGKEGNKEMKKLRMLVIPIFNKIGWDSRKTAVLACLFLLVAPLARAGEEDLDNYRWRVTAFWWFSQPSGYYKDTSGNTFDLQRDFGFPYYSTFSGTLDWKFKRKHHLIFGVSPIESSHAASLTRTITFQGNTYNVGTLVTADIHSFSFAPGYQWDFIRRDHGYLGILAQINLLDSTASLTGTVTVNGQSVTRTASGSRLAPLPILGLHGRWYPMHDSNRLALEGQFQGMYFFGYGDFYSAKATAGYRVVSSLRLTAGYQLGTRLSIHGSSDEIGIRLTQKGAVVGIEGSW
jgi:hypothetical protein